MVRKRKALFLCTGNSCRSQMAEAIVNARLGDRWEAFSAGTVPEGFVHPAAIRVLEEIGIVHVGQSKHADTYREAAFDLVVTVCDDAAETCPTWLGKGRRVHLGFPDPGRVVGNEDETLETFRRVRDDIARQVAALLAEVAPGPESSEPLSGAAGNRVAQA